MRHTRRRFKAFGELESDQTGNLESNSSFQRNGDSDSRCSNTAAPSCDRLTTMPSEIIQEILGYLFESHFPCMTIWAADHPQEAAARHARDYHVNFSRLLTLNKRMNLEMHQFCTSFMARHTRLFAKRRDVQFWADPITNVVRWLRRYCVWCGKRCKRDGIMMNGMRTCTACDRREWPEKVSLDEIESYGVDESDLCEEGYPDHDMAVSHRVRFGTYFGGGDGISRMMFFRKDVIAACQRVHHKDGYRMKKLAAEQSRKAHPGSE